MDVSQSLGSSFNPSFALAARKSTQNAMKLMVGTAKDRSPETDRFGGVIARAELRVTAANQPALRFNIAATSFIDWVGKSPSLTSKPKQQNRV
jgi:hypothetical protein